MDSILKEAGLDTTEAEIQERLSEVATIANARKWAEENEQFIFCIDLLEMSAHDSKADGAVNRLEALFEKLLATNA